MQASEGFRRPRVVVGLLEGLVAVTLVGLGYWYLVGGDAPARREADVAARGAAVMLTSGHSARRGGSAVPSWTVALHAGEGCPPLPASTGTPASSGSRCDGHGVARRSTSADLESHSGLSRFLSRLVTGARAGALVH